MEEQNVKWRIAIVINDEKKPWLALVKVWQGLSMKNPAASDTMKPDPGFYVMAKKQDRND